MFAATLAVAVVAVGCNSGVAAPAAGEAAALPSSNELPPEFERLTEVWKLLKEDHVDRERLDPEAMSEGAIRGMLLALEDPYASFLSRQQFELESQDFKGYFEGIGAQVAMDEGRLTIIAPLPNTPAERAGIRPGDVILEIDGNSTDGITLLEAVTKIRGEKDTTVVLLVLHLNETEPVTIGIRRGVIPLESVEFEMLPDGIGYLRISSFTDTTGEEVEKALDRLEASNGRGLVVDLRNNPGGLLTAVVDVASEFLSYGLVLYEINSHGERTDWKVRSGGQAQDIPMVVLINQFSASASEVFSGAIIDHQRGQVLGVTSFGKGSVNTLRALKDGSGLYFSIARWYTPNGSLIEGVGVTPDVLVEAGPEDAEDLQLQLGLRILQGQIAQGG
jgi:carboxyl-terminal processing protease